MTVAIPMSRIPTTILLLTLLATGCHNPERILHQTLEESIIERADSLSREAPVTVTSEQCPRSAGGIHDFYSEGDYWWPDPQNPDGPYIRRDGESNPGNFSAHRHAMVRLSDIVGTLTSAYILTGQQRYADAVEKHIQAWFIDEATMMNPNLLYAQAIKGIATGRGIGIIDTIHLCEVAQSLIRLGKAGEISEETLEGAKRWFSSYLEWMCTHPYGVKEMNAKNNHGTCWAVQAAVFAKLTGNEEVAEFCRERYKDVFLPSQMAPDGSFPLELARTKPYGYSLFNLDAFGALCQILSTPEDDLFAYETPDGKNFSKGMKFMLPFIEDKQLWTYGRDVSHWDEWPVAHPSLIFYWNRFGDKECLRLWKRLDHFPTGEEVIRNLPLRNPVIWL